MERHPARRPVLTYEFDDAKRQPAPDRPAVRFQADDVQELIDYLRWPVHIAPQPLEYQAVAGDRLYSKTAVRSSGVDVVTVLAPVARMLTAETFAAFARYRNDPSIVALEFVDPIPAARLREFAANGSGIDIDTRTPGIRYDRLDWKWDWMDAAEQDGFRARLAGIFGEYERYRGGEWEPAHLCLETRPERGPFLEFNVAEWCPLAMLPFEVEKDAAGKWAFGAAKAA